MECRPVRAGRHPPQAADEPHASFDRDLDVPGIDAGQRRDDGQLLLGLEHIDWRLPIHGASPGWKNRRCNCSARSIIAQASAHIQLLGSAAVIAPALSGNRVLSFKS